AGVVVREVGDGEGAGQGPALQGLQGRARPPRGLETGTNERAASHAEAPLRVGNDWIAPQPGNARSGADYASLAQKKLAGPARMAAGGGPRGVAPPPALGSSTS